MAFTPGLTERTWPSVILTPISISGHVITVDSTLGLKVKMSVVLSKPGLDSERFEIKRVYSETSLMVGPIGSNIKKISDAEKFNGGTLSVPEQSRNKLGDSPIIRAVYEEEPTIAIRTINVDPFGVFYDKNNPLPVQLQDGNIKIGTVNADLEVQLSHKDDYPNLGDIADSVQIGDGEETLAINTDGSITVKISPNAIGDFTNIYNEVSSVAASIYTTIVTYTVPVGRIAYLIRAEFSGTNIATYKIELNSNVISCKRTWFNGNMSDSIEFDSPNGSGLPLEAGDVVKIQVEHSRPFLGDFEGRIQVIEN